MQSSYNPDEVRNWIDEKAKMGFNAHAIKGMLCLSDEALHEVCSLIYYALALI
jgi:hypothetical protein